MKKYVIGAAFLSLLAAAMPASASTVVKGKCISVADKAGCLFDGNINSNPNGKANSYLSAQNAYNLYNDMVPTARPDITLNILASTDDKSFSSFGTFSGIGGITGTWSLPGYLVDFVAVKASNQFTLYQLATPASSGTWTTTNIPFKKNAHGLSHLTFFGTRAPVVAAVPEPASWAMMIFGFGAVGGAMRRRGAARSLRLA